MELLEENITAAAASGGATVAAATAGELGATTTADLGDVQEAAAATEPATAAEKASKGSIGGIRVDVGGLEAAQWLPIETSEQLAAALYIADTLSQFGKQLGVKGSGFSAQELQEAAEMVAGAAAAAEAGQGDGEGKGAVPVEKESAELVAAQQWLAGLYQQLLQVRFQYTSVCHSKRVIGPAP